MVSSATIVAVRRSRTILAAVPRMVITDDVTGIRTMSRMQQWMFPAAVVAWIVAALGGAVADEPTVDQPNQEQEQQQVQQIEQMLQPLVHAELEFIRNACGTLGPEAKRAIKAAVTTAVREFARGFVAEQQRPGRRSLDVGPILARHLDPVVERHARPDAVAAWRRERDARRERRAETARLLIVAKLDETLELTAAQREAILAGLRTGWKDVWLCELTDVGGFMINNQRPAPDFAAAAITPHLDGRQRQAWDNWVRAAGWRHASVHLGWRFPDGPGLRGADPWWGQ